MSGETMGARAVLAILDPNGEGRDTVQARLCDTADRMANPSHKGNQHRWPEHARMFRDLAAFLAKVPASPDPVQLADAIEGLDVVTVFDNGMGLVWSCTCRATGAGASVPVRKAARDHARKHLAAREAAWAEKYAAVVREGSLSEAADDLRAALAIPTATGDE